MPKKLAEFQAAVKKIEAAPLKKAAIPAKPASGKSTGH